jgi:signal transduction histidine kinase
MAPNSVLSDQLGRAAPWAPPLLARGGALVWAGANLAVALLYFGLGLIVSRFFAAYGLFPAPIWLPASIAMVAAMIGGLRLAPGLFLGSFLANHVLFAPPLHITAIVSLGNAFGPVAAALLMRRLRLAGRLFTSFGGVAGFLACTTLLAPAISAAGGTLALAVGKPFDASASYSIWLTWWLSDSGGTLYLACALILWLGLEREPEGREDAPLPALGRRELGVWGTAAGSSLALFLTPLLEGGGALLGFPFLLVVPLSWVALRMSLRSAYSLVSLVAIVATVGTVAGGGPFHNDGLANPLALVGVLVVLLAMNVLTIEALVSERREAENARRVKAMFLAKTSHELRQPLNAILGFSSLIDQQALGPLSNQDYAGYGRIIHSSGEHLLALINDLLDMSKIEAGQIELREERVRLAEAIDDAVSLIELQAREAGVGLEVAVEDPALAVLADRKALRQILLNLLSNAVKFTPADGRVRVGAQAAAGGGVLLSVADTGMGVPAEAQKRLFAPFERARRAGVEGVEGTGLGLAITKGLVLLHGGSIALESEEGRGATVTVALPESRVVRANPGSFPKPRAAAA